MAGTLRSGPMIVGGYHGPWTRLSVARCHLRPADRKTSDREMSGTAASQASGKAAARLTGLGSRTASAVTISAASATSARASVTSAATGRQVREARQVSAQAVSTRRLVAISTVTRTTGPGPAGTTTGHVRTTVTVNTGRTGAEHLAAAAVPSLDTDQVREPTPGVSAGTGRCLPSSGQAPLSLRTVTALIQGSAPSAAGLAMRMAVAASQASEARRANEARATTGLLAARALRGVMARPAVARRVAARPGVTGTDVATATVRRMAISRQTGTTRRRRRGMAGPRVMGRAARERTLMATHGMANLQAGTPCRRAGSSGPMATGVMVTSVRATGLRGTALRGTGLKVAGLAATPAVAIRARAITGTTPLPMRTVKRLVRARTDTRQITARPMPLGKAPATARAMATARAVAKAAMVVTVRTGAKAAMVATVRIGARPGLRSRQRLRAC